MIGQSFGYLTVIARSGRSPNGKTRWLCTCRCANFKTVRRDHLTRGLVVSCGCYWQQRRSEIHTTHGHSKGRKLTSEFIAWLSMRQRCSNPDNPRFKYHAGMGVTVHPLWQESFEAFLRDVGPKPAPEYSLDRYPDPWGNYEPGNVRWATRREQYYNQRKFHPRTPA